MKILRIIISDFQQFKYFNLDLTNSEGKPLDKICFIGKNGTGKTTILNLIKSQLNFVFANQTDRLFPIYNNLNYTKSQVGFEIEINGSRFLIGRIFGAKIIDNIEQSRGSLIKLKYDYYKNIPNFIERIFLNKDFDLVDSTLSESDRLFSDFEASANFFPYTRTLTENVLIYSPAEVTQINPTGTPRTEIFQLSNLDDAQAYFTNFPFFHDVAFENLKNYWSLITYQVRKRESDQRKFENSEENLNKTKAELNKLFDDNYPDFLRILAEKWQIILDVPGLYFDYEHAVTPVQLKENLVAHIKTKKDNVSVPFYSLSTGIKQLLLRYGYLLSLYYKRNIKSGIALIDEPENSLYPDLLLNIIDVYTNREDFPNSQFFFATHSPLIASQFKPEERISLDFDENYKVTFKKGIAPLGDDPDDLLLQDFGMAQVMSKYGVQKWDEYQELKKRIEKEGDINKKKELMKKFADLRQSYRFPSI